MFRTLLLFTAFSLALCKASVTSALTTSDTSSTGTISLTITYDNNIHSPITNTKVLLRMNGVNVDSAMTDNNGHCEFDNLPPAAYQCIPVCTKPWGGGNSADCQAIYMNFVHLNGFYLTGLRLVASEVNGQAVQNPGSLDALLTQKRFIGQISTFLPPVAIPGNQDWRYETPTFYISGTETLTHTIKMLCTGDSNGSYIPQ